MHSHIEKHHRTILFVDGRNMTSTYIERANRLIDSLNGPQIKVDVHIVRQDTTPSVRVDPLHGHVTTYSQDQEDSFDLAALHALAQEWGYDQVLFSLPG